MMRQELVHFFSTKRPFRIGPIYSNQLNWHGTHEKNFRAIFIHKGKARKKQISACFQVYGMATVTFGTFHHIFLIIWHEAVVTRPTCTIFSSFLFLFFFFFVFHVYGLLIYEILWANDEKSELLIKTCVLTKNYANRNKSLKSCWQVECLAYFVVKNVNINKTDKRENEKDLEWL